MTALAALPLAKRRLTGTLGQRIKARLGELEGELDGAPMTWLAGRVGVTAVHMSRIANDKQKDLPLSTLRKIATALGLTLSELLAGIETDEGGGSAD